MPEFSKPENQFLEAQTTIAIPARAEPFDVRSRFEKAAGIRFATVWNEFKKRFYGKIEEPAQEHEMRRFRLLCIAPDAPIIDELGGPSAVECSVADAFTLIRLQGHGQEGVLQTNGFANIFYCRDQRGNLCAVRVGWDGEGWVVDAISVEDPLAWNGKHAIFSPVRANVP